MSETLRTTPSTMQSAKSLAGHDDAASAAAEPATDAADAAPHGKLLYIEDVMSNVAAVAGLLAAYPGVQLLHAATGVEGVHRALHEQPDFVLLAMQLPDMGGLEVVRRLNEEIVSRGLRVTLLTGQQLSMDIIKAMSLGAFEYWVKPLQATVFNAGLMRAMSGGQPDPARTLKTPRATSLLDAEPAGHDW